MREEDSRTQSVEEFQSFEAESGAERGEGLSLAIYFESEASLERQAEDLNQDQELVDAEHQLFGVFDGVGGQAGGQEASRTAAAKIREVAAAIPNEVAVDNVELEVVAPLRQAFSAAQEELVRKQRRSLSERRKAREAGEEASPELYGMGTTATVAKMLKTEQGPRAVIAHVGDTSAYRVTRGGEVEKLTIDDGLVTRTEDGRYYDLNREITETQYLMLRHYLSKVVGGHERNWHEAVDPAIIEVALEPGDRLVLLSDGVSDNFRDERKVIAETMSAADPAEALVGRARAEAVAGSAKDESGELKWEVRESGQRKIVIEEPFSWAKHDDMTAVVVEVGTN